MPEPDGGEDAWTGAAVGSASFVVPLYISELSPSPFRGRLVVVSSLFITGGQVVAYIIGWLFSERLHGWRWMVGLGALPAAIQFVMLFFLPETPRYLVKAGRIQQARKVLGRVYKTDESGTKLVNAVLRRVEKEIEEEEDAAGLRGTPDGTKSGWRAKIERVQDVIKLLSRVVRGREERSVLMDMSVEDITPVLRTCQYVFTSTSIDALEQDAKNRNHERRRTHIQTVAQKLQCI